MTPFPTQGSARAWGGVCFAVVERFAKAGTVSRLAEPLKSALSSRQRRAGKYWRALGVAGGSGAARQGRAKGNGYD